MGLPGTVLGIPGYLVSWDPWDSMPGGTTWDCPGYPGILSISGSIPSGTTRDYPGYLGILHVILGCRMYPGMSRVVLGQAVAVLDIPRSIVCRGRSATHVQTKIMSGLGDQIFWNFARPVFS